MDVASIAVTVDGSSFATRFTTTAMAKATTIIPMENAPGAIFLVLTEYLRFLDQLAAQKQADSDHRQKIDHACEV